MYQSPQAACGLTHRGKVSNCDIETLHDISRLSSQGTNKPSCWSKNFLAIDATALFQWQLMLWRVTTLITSVIGTRKYTPTKIQILMASHYHT